MRRTLRTTRWRQLREALEPIIAHGLVRREGRFLRAPAIVKPEMLVDWALWVVASSDVRELRWRGRGGAMRALGGGVPSNRLRRLHRGVSPSAPGRQNASLPLVPRSSVSSPAWITRNTRCVRRSHSNHGLRARARRQRRHVVEGEDADPLPGVRRSRVRPQRRGDVREAYMPEPASPARQDGRRRGLKLRKASAEEDDRLPRALVSS